MGAFGCLTWQVPSDTLLGLGEDVGDLLEIDETLLLARRELELALLQGSGMCNGMCNGKCNGMCNGMCNGPRSIRARAPARERGRRRQGVRAGGEGRE